MILVFMAILMSGRTIHEDARMAPENYRARCGGEVLGDAGYALESSRDAIRRPSVPAAL